MTEQELLDEIACTLSNILAQDNAYYEIDSDLRSEACRLLAEWRSKARLERAQ